MKIVAPEDKKEKYIKVRLNDAELKEFEIACSMMEMNKTNLMVNAIREYLAKENIEIWKDLRPNQKRK